MNSNISMYLQVKQKLVNRQTVWESDICGLIWITCLREYYFNSVHFSGAMWKAKQLTFRDSYVGCEAVAVLEYEWEKRPSCNSPTGQNSSKTFS